MQISISEKSSIPYSITDVVTDGLCVGCGACAVSNNKINMFRTKYGVMKAELGKLNETELRKENLVCPFSDYSENEDSISEKMFSINNNSYDIRVGYYNNLYVGRILNNNEIIKSSSGGLTSWVCSQLLMLNLIDGVIHVGENKSNNNDLFEFTVSHSQEEINLRKKSQYYSLSFEKAINQIKHNGKKYAFVGVPCNVKAMRNLCKIDNILNEQFPFMLALVCGHMKSSAFAELLSWQVGVKVNEIKKVDFRKKNPKKQANMYDFSSENKNGAIKFERASNLVGGNWGHAVFQLEACDYCDDIFGETADAVFGDAWLSNFIPIWQGTNIVLSRNPSISIILAEGLKNKEIYLEFLSLDDFCKSQDGNFRHRREGLSLRLQEDNVHNIRRPLKRITAETYLTNEKRLAIVRLRKKIAKASHEIFYEAKKTGSLNYFLDKFEKYIDEINRVNKISFKAKIKIKLFRIYKKTKFFLHKFH